MRRECSHAAARIALVIGSAVLSFSLSAPALASGSAPARSARHHATARAHGSHKTHHTSSKTHKGAAKPHRSATKPHHAAPARPHPHAAKPKLDAAKATAPEPSTAAQVASVLATTCQNTEITPEAANIALVRDAVMCLVNRVRAEHGEPPLKASADLERAADEHSRELVELDYFAHVSPSGLTPVQRIRETGYIPGPEFGYVIGENLAWGTLNLATPQSIVNAWVASPGHLANILESQYKETGIGIVPAAPPSYGNGQPGATYAQEFGVLLE